MIEYRDISFSTDGYVMYKGIVLSVTREQIFDYQSQTGLDGIMLVEWAYENNISVIRDKRIEEILSSINKI